MQIKARKIQKNFEGVCRELDLFIQNFSYLEKDDLESRVREELVTTKEGLQNASLNQGGVIPSDSH
jgi:hypothetical protein